MARKDHGLIASECRDDEHLGMAQVEDRPLVHARRPTRVLIADDSAQIRRELIGLFALADDIEVIAEAVNGVQAVALAAQMMPDIVVMDLAMPVMDGIPGHPADPRCAAYGPSPHGDSAWRSRAGSA